MKMADEELRSFVDLASKEPMRVENASVDSQLALRIEIAPELAKEVLRLREALWEIADSFSSAGAIARAALEEKK